MTAILKEEPKSVRSLSADVPLELERLVDRCLEKQAEQRFQTSKDMAYSLRSILAAGGGRRLAPRRNSLLRWTAVGLVGVTAVAAGLFYLTRVRPTPAVDAIESIAVLPFVNASGDPNEEYFVDGMTDALIADLAKIRALKVISRTSAMQFKGVKKPLPDIARELKVEAVVDGSVLRAGDRVRITAQLIHAGTDENLWADSYERDLRDVLTLQSEVARTIAEEIKVTLTPKEQARMAAARPVNPEAYQAYVKGRFYWNKRTAEGLKKAVEYFDQAIALAPDWPLGYAGLADAYVLMPAYSSMRSSEANPKARAAAAKALEIDESLGEARTTMGYIAVNDWDWRAAEREYQRALALSPNYATAHQWYAEYLAYMGRHDEAIKEITKAQELDPLSLIIGSNAGWVHYFVGDLEQAETSLRKTLELGPDFAMAHQFLALTVFQQGKFAEAIKEAREAVRLSNNEPSALLGYMCAKAGQPEEARRILEEHAALSKESHVPPTTFAVVHAGLDERDRMFEWLERAHQDHDVLLLEMLPNPILAEFRSDPRFIDLLRRVGLPPLTPPPRTTAPSQAQPAKSKVTLAVLPFENLSRDPDQEFFSDGLTEEMISQLGRLNPEKLGVIARSSAMHYKKADRAIERVKRELGVDYVVEGSVRRHEDGILITARLVETNNQTQIWADSFEPEVKNLLTWQRTVAQAIAKQIKITLAPQEQSRIAEARPVNPEAYEAYLKGRFYWAKRTPDGLKKAVEYLEQSILLDPGWALAFAGLADAYALMPFYSVMRPSDAIPKAKAAAAKAMQLDESLGEAHVSLGWIATTYDWDWATAEREHQRALALSPNYATAHHWYWALLLFTGRHEEALSAITKAQELDPLSLVIGTSVGMQHYYTGDFVKAAAQLRKTLELGTEFAHARSRLTAALYLQGKLPEAISEAREAARLRNDDARNVAILGYICAKAGQPEEARGILDQLTLRWTESYVAPTHFALVYAGLGERERMFEWLERAYQEHDLTLVFTLPDPILAEFRGDPRFADLLRRVGLPPSALHSPTKPEPNSPGDPP
jgi:TolB-like protein/Flp pilus assembly protein TadD